MRTRILKYDLKLIRKDPMLLFMLIAPVFFWALLYFVFPILASFMLEKWNINILPYFNYAVAFFLPLIPMMFGMVYGFILLDERDEGIITAISITPYGKEGYLKIRMFFPMVYSFMAMLLFYYALGNPFRLPFWQISTIILILTLNAPLMLLFLGAFAKNKIEGMAITKGFNLLLMAILIDYLAPAPFNWLGGFSQFFWMEKACFASNLQQFLLFISMGLILHLSYFIFLFKQFIRKNG